MLRKTTLIAAALSMVSLPTFAGSPEPAPYEPVIAPAAPAAPASPDWSGFYAGAQLGFGDVNTSLPGVSGDDVIGGLTAGYDFDLGKYVVGFGADYDFADIGVSPTVDVENIFRLKMRSGIKTSPRGLLYITGGYAHLQTSGLGDEDGKFYGAGYEHFVTDNVTLGGEVLHHEFYDIGSTTTDADATTYQVRATFRF